MTGNYRKLSELPPYEVARWENKGDAKPTNAAPGKTLWGVAAAPPAIGTRVRVTMNSLGPGTVRGYFIDHDWLGLLVELHNPPEWWLAQNHPARPLAHIFGIEFKLEES